MGAVLAGWWGQRVSGGPRPGLEEACLPQRCVPPVLEQTGMYSELVFLLCRDASVKRFQDD